MGSRLALCGRGSTTTVIPHRGPWCWQKCRLSVGCVFPNSGDAQRKGGRVEFFAPWREYSFVPPADQPEPRRRLRKLRNYWKPNTTVAGIVERNGKFLMIEERTRDGLRLNQPSGHLNQGESLLQAVEREVLEESGHVVQASAGVGIYMCRYVHDATDTDITYLRITFVCRSLSVEPDRVLDKGVVRVLWLTAAEIRARADFHRSPAVMQSIDDYLRGKRFPLELIYTDQSCFYSMV